MFKNFFKRHAPDEFYDVPDWVYSTYIFLSFIVSIVCIYFFIDYFPDGTEPKIVIFCFLLILCSIGILGHRWIAGGSFVKIIPIFFTLNGVAISILFFGKSLVIILLISLGLFLYIPIIWKFLFKKNDHLSKK